MEKDLKALIESGWMIDRRKPPTEARCYHMSKESYLADGGTEEDRGVVEGEPNASSLEPPSEPSSDEPSELPQ